MSIRRLALWLAYIVILANWIRDLMIDPRQWFIATALAIAIFLPWVVVRWRRQRKTNG